MRLKQVLTLALIAACGMGLVACTAESKKNRTSYDTRKGNVSEEVHER